MKVFKIGQSIQGVSHISENIPCQDACNITTLQDGTIIIAVADGHGSAKCKYSDIGAKLATDVFLEEISCLFQTTDEREELIHLLRQEESFYLSKHICKQWNKKVESSYEQIKQSDIENQVITPEFSTDLFGTTLLGLVVAHDFVFAMQIGDGDMVFVDNLGVQRILEPAKFLGVETYSLSNEEAWKNSISYFQRLEFEKKAPCAFIVSTDGFSNSFINDKEYFISCKGYFDNIMNYGAEAVQDNLEEWLHETSKEGCGDDITLVMVGAGIES